MPENWAYGAGLAPWLVTLAAIGYAGAIFWLAWRVERRPQSEARLQRAWPWIYALSIGVYFTSWSFFGAVGAAASSGWAFLPIYLGPALVFLFGLGFLQRLARAVREERAVSIADFISARFGKSRIIATSITLIAILGAVPYIALQLRAIGMTFAEITVGAPGAAENAMRDQAALISALTLAAFTIMFGARRYDASGRNRGLVVAMAADSAIKFIALTAVALMAIALVFAASPEQRAAGSEQMRALFDPAGLTPSLVTMTVLSMAAIVCLPRQFYITFIEARDPAHLGAARWGFLAMLGLTTLAVGPITLAGLMWLPATAAPDLYVLDLPLVRGDFAMALLVFIGGFAAAAGMVVVATTALSTMIANDLVAPILMRNAHFARGADIGRALLFTRRVAILVFLLLAYGYYLAVDGAETLAAIGLIAFAAMVQFAPSLIAAVNRAALPPRAVRAGLAAGGFLWGYTLFLPSILGADGLHASGLTGVLGGALHPQALFWTGFLDPLTHGVVWSLGLNLAAMLGYGWFLRRQGAAGLGWLAPGPQRMAHAANVGDLIALAERFVGPLAARDAFERHAKIRGAPLQESDALDRPSARLAEQLIASVIGAPSARVIIGSALSGASLDVGRVVSLLDETSQELQFSRELLSSTLEHISQGVSVVDKDMRLVAWNRRYIEMFEYPPGLVAVGRPIADVIRYNAARGDCGPGEVDAHVEKRLAHMRRAADHEFERVRQNGMVLKTIGRSMPGGGYVTTYTDITAEKAAQAALARANESLEERVRRRTQDLEAEAALNRRLAEELHRAKQAADAANSSKTKFLAAASHDLLQPLHAARLFNQALAEAVAGDGAASRAALLAQNTDRAIASADRLLRALLDISKLEAGGVTPSPTHFAIASLVEELATEFAPMAQAKGLRLLSREPCDCTVETDRTLLRSILQNFLANAIRYTSDGGVLIGCRWRADTVRVEVWDTGPGMPVEELDLIFREFSRFDRPGQSERGAGLGLSIAQRCARLIDAELAVASRQGRGSMFAVEVARRAGHCDTGARPQRAGGAAARATPDVAGLRVLCLDNDPAILDAISMVLEAWGAEPFIAAEAEEALALLGATPIDAAIVDLQLDGAMTGLDVIREARASGWRGPAALLTADPSDATRVAATRLGLPLIPKPAEPARIRAFLAGAVQSQDAAAAE